MQKNVCQTKGARYLRAEKNTLLLEQHNKQFVNECENWQCPPPAFTHAFNLLVKFLTALLTERCRTSTAVNA